MTYSHRTYATAALFLTSSILQLPTRFQTSHFLTVVDAADISPATFSQFNNPPNEIAAVPSHNNNNNNQFFMGSYPTYAATGPIGDATCDVEQLEQANDSQLHVILAELMTTSFFRSFAVDLDERCPLAGWNTKKKKNKKSEKKDGAGATTSAKDSSSTSSTTTMNVPTTLETSGDGEEEEEGCAGELPDLDPDAEPACSVDLGGGQPGFLGGGGGGGGAFSSGFSSSSTSSTTSTSLPPSFSTEATADTSTTDEDEDEEEFECDGGKDELDDDAEPLCSLATDESQNNNPFFGGGNNNNNPTDESAKFASAALSRVGDQSSWESESQQQTFQWARPSDPVIENYDEPCGSEVDQAGNLPETFWLDMCSQIHAGDGLSIVNLQLNPERNTGYNGTHIWNAIYEENCLALDGSASAPMCYEERVLYRLLSGLHTSTTLSIAKNYYPPSKRKGRVNWEPNAQYFIDKFADHPEHLRNLHFSYVVLLRALKKASPFFVQL
mmetsp:Transcript_34339/g.72252  ORF Transcript_34339/g.72252 Transcript_34339/m.72252 type:complete len:497 (+) Transcript_34339:130-1620(+)